MDTLDNRIQFHIIKRDEWLKCLQELLTPAINRNIRNMYGASTTLKSDYPQYKDAKLSDIFFGMVERVKQWDVKSRSHYVEQGRLTDAEVCLSESVREHAIVLSLATENPVKASIKIMPIGKFYDNVLITCCRELFNIVDGSNDIYSKKTVKKHIDYTISIKAKQCVPLKEFTLLRPTEINEVKVKAPENEMENESKKENENETKDGIENENKENQDTQVKVVKIDAKEVEDKAKELENRIKEREKSIYIPVKKEEVSVPIKKEKDETSDIPTLKINYKPTTYEEDEHNEEQD